MKQKILVCFFFMGFLSLANSQESFSYLIGSPNYDFGYSLIESPQYYFMIGSSNSVDVRHGAYVCRFSNSTDLIGREITKQDTLCRLFYGSIVDSSKILLVGRIDVENMQYLYTCIMTEDLIIHDEKYYNILPDGYDWFDFYDMSGGENGDVVIIGHMDDHLPGTLNGLIIVRIDQDGNLVDYKSYISIHYNSNEDSDLLKLADGSGYYYFNAGSMNILEFNNSLELVDSSNWLGSYPYTLGSRVTANYLPDGNLGFLDMISNTSYYYDVRFMKFTPDFEYVNDTIIVKEGRQSPAIFKGMDYTNPNQVWVLLHNDNPTNSGTEDYEILLLDSQLNIIDSKVFNGKSDYGFSYLLATSDGGCLVTGSIRQEYGTNLTDIFILKVMPEDIITGLPDISLPDQKEVAVYPNPFDEKIFTKTETKGSIFKLYNLKGEVVLQSPISPDLQGMLNTTGILPGVYIFSIANEHGKVVQSGKLIK